ncbi:MAG: ABC transporter ATP-binding protein [Armatimonadota bacterium]
MIKIRNLVIRLGSKDILKNINLDVEKGETLVVMGLSGVGKSTLLKAITGLLRPFSGDIYIEGKNVTNLSGKELDRVRRKVGMVFQSPALFDSLNVGDNVAFGLREFATHMKEEEIQQVVGEMLSIVDLEGKSHLMPAQLSGGMQKRASLARTIAIKPEVILYDEPTTGLDPIMSNVISGLINDLKKRLSATSVVVTHDLESAYQVGDKIAMLYNGKIVACGTKDEFIKSKDPVVQQFIHGSIKGPIKV